MEEIQKEIWEEYKESDDFEEVDFQKEMQLLVD